MCLFECDECVLVRKDAMDGAILTDDSSSACFLLLLHGGVYNAIYVLTVLGGAVNRLARGSCVPAGRGQPLCNNWSGSSFVGFS